MDKPRLNNQLIYFQKENGKILIFNKYTKKSFILEKELYNILMNFDGTKTLNEIADLYNMSYDALSSIFEMFVNKDLMEQNPVKREFNIFKIKIGLFHPDNSLSGKKKIIKIMWFFIIYLSIPIFILGLMGMRHEVIIMPNRLLGYLSSNILFVIISTLISVLLHEMSHVIVAKYYNANIAEIGIMLYCFIPCAYTSVCGMSLIQSRYKKMQFALAGVLTNFQLAGIGLILYNIFLTEKYYVFFFINFLFILTNLLIFLKLDGYYVIQEILGISDLMDKSKAYTYYKFGRLFKKNKSNISNYNLFDEFIFCIYGINSFLLLVIFFILSINQIINWI